MAVRPKSGIIHIHTPLGRCASLLSLSPSSSSSFLLFLLFSLSLSLSEFVHVCMRCGVYGYIVQDTWDLIPCTHLHSTLLFHLLFFFFLLFSLSLRDYVCMWCNWKTHMGFNPNCPPPWPLGVTLLSIGHFDSLNFKIK